MVAFDHVFDILIVLEGGFSDNKNDSGGKTRWGVTEAVAREFGYKGRMEDFLKDEAKKLYKKKYWDVLNLDNIANISYEVAYEMFDTSVNMGVSYAGTFLQRSLNVFNKQGAVYKDLKVDGLIGNMSLTALKSFIAYRGKKGVDVLLKALNSLQGSRYIDLSEAYPKNEDFVFGWFSNRI